MLHVFISKAITYFKRNTAFFGYPKIVNLPYKYWHKIDIAEKKFWDEDNYIYWSKSIKTIFEILREERIQYITPGLQHQNCGEIDFIKIPKFQDYRFVYFFIGDLDPISHRYLQHSQEGIMYIEKLDSFIEKVYKKFENRHSDFTFFCWSDHGHIPINNQINLYQFFKQNGDNLNNYFHIVDSTLVRFWPKDDAECKKIQSIMFRIGGVYQVNEELLNKYHLPNRNSHYYNLIFGLRAGNTFNKTIWGFGKKQRSMHGYLPEEEGNDGLFVSNKPIYVNKVTLPDIFAVIVDQLSLGGNYLEEVDGRNVLTKGNRKCNK